LNVVVVAGIVVRYDAISDAVVDQLSILRRLPTVDELTLVTQGFDRDDHELRGIDVVVTADAWALARLPAFRRADVVVFHWGIAYELFDALTIAATPNRLAAVHFHNVTPPELLTGADAMKAPWSQQQLLAVAAYATEAWTYSRFNEVTLLDLGVDPARLRHVPISIVPPPSEPSPARRRDGVDLLTVGRAVPAKGIHVLLRALSLVPMATRDLLTLTIAGNLRLSDDAYAASIAADAAGMAGVTLVDRPTRDELWRLYARSHVVVSPSFHEGLCVPVLEGYLAGCRAVGTTAGNLPHVVIAPDPVVSPGDAEELALAIERVVHEVMSGRTAPSEASISLVRSFAPEAVESSLDHALRCASQCAVDPPR
jgi:glycosyltransferase involved in cell wall biosynthesis